QLQSPPSVGSEAGDRHLRNRMRVSALRRPSPCVDEFLLGVEQLGTVDGSQYLAPLHPLAGLVDVQLLDPAREARMDLRQALFVGSDVSDRTQILVQTATLHLRGPHAEELHALGTEVDRGES